MVKRGINGKQIMKYYKNLDLVESSNNLKVKIEKLENSLQRMNAVENPVSNFRMMMMEEKLKTFSKNGHYFR